MKAIQFDVGLGEVHCNYCAVSNKYVRLYRSIGDLTSGVTAYCNAHIPENIIAVPMIAFMSVTRLGEMTEGDLAKWARLPDMLGYNEGGYNYFTSGVYKEKVTNE